MDFTRAEELQVTIAGEPFPHMLFELILSCSRWRFVQICFGETFEALVKGVQDALWDLGGLTEVLRSDNLSAATYQLLGEGKRKPTCADCHMQDLKLISVWVSYSAPSERMTEKLMERCDTGRIMRVAGLED